MEDVSMTKLVVLLVVTLCWIINLVQFVSSDFEEPYGREIVKAVGVVVPVTSCITMFINPDDGE